MPNKNQDFLQALNGLKNTPETLVALKELINIDLSQPNSHLQFGNVAVNHPSIFTSADWLEGEGVNGGLVSPNDFGVVGGVPNNARQLQRLAAKKYIELFLETAADDVLKQVLTARTDKILRTDLGKQPFSDFGVILSWNAQAGNPAMLTDVLLNEIRLQASKRLYKAADDKVNKAHEDIAQGIAAPLKLEDFQNPVAAVAPAPYAPVTDAEKLKIKEILKNLSNLKEAVKKYEEVKKELEREIRTSASDPSKELHGLQKLVDEIDRKLQDDKVLIEAYKLKVAAKAPRMEEITNFSAQKVIAEVDAALAPTAAPTPPATKGSVLADKAKELEKDVSFLQEAFSVIELSAPEPLLPPRKAEIDAIKAQKNEAEGKLAILQLAASKQLAEETEIKFKALKFDDTTSYALGHSQFSDAEIHLLKVLEAQKKQAEASLAQLTKLGLPLVTAQQDRDTIFAQHKRVSDRIEDLRIHYGATANMMVDSTRSGHFKTEVVKGGDVRVIAEATEGTMITDTSGPMTAKVEGKGQRQGVRLGTGDIIRYSASMQAEKSPKDELKVILEQDKTGRIVDRTSKADFERLSEKQKCVLALEMAVQFLDKYDPNDPKYDPNDPKYDPDNEGKSPHEKLIYGPDKDQVSRVWAACLYLTQGNDYYKKLSIKPGIEVDKEPGFGLMTRDSTAINKFKDEMLSKVSTGTLDLEKTRLREKNVDTKFMSGELKALREQKDGEKKMRKVGNEYPFRRPS